MELKVWVQGVVRVVCGLSENTSCQDVVIALAQAIGQTGRYILILKLRGTERQLVADERPLQHLAHLGQQAAEVQFVLRRTGPSLSEGKETPTREGRFPLHGPSEPEPLKRNDPHKALSFSLGPSTHPKRMKSNREWSPSPRASPEPRASPVSFLDPPSSSSSSKEEVFKQILQQQRRLQDLDLRLEALEGEAEVLERTSDTVLSLTPALEAELEELEQRLRQNQDDLKHREQWEQQLQEEMDREQDLHSRLHQINSSLDDHSYQIEELQSQSAHLEQDIQLRGQKRISRADTVQPEEALKQELHVRLQQGAELEATLSRTRREIENTQTRQQGRWEKMEELNKELRQCELQQFIQQAGSPHVDQTSLLPGPEGYLCIAGIME
ncbi:ras association domain-containing protein 7-like [Pseudochaenichthys georgianus]|uniref:ras association domain-containing protein 7-like n=1 Tax=Pseudochaenichthys georgianus TaxID=52239 RepID=UPI00146AAE2C|nr:ras association domain-containing protein 7-like [Pseudochaenichthys georgianus]